MSLRRVPFGRSWTWPSAGSAICWERDKRAGPSWRVCFRRAGPDGGGGALPVNDARAARRCWQPIRRWRAWSMRGLAVAARERARKIRRHVRGGGLFLRMTGEARHGRLGGAVGGGARRGRAGRRCGRGDGDPGRHRGSQRRPGGPTPAQAS